jgi:DNA-binding NarL/FixJ family response regulator
MQFTQREQQVLQLLAQGMCNKTIGQQLGISPHTVRDHVCAMLLRTGCDNRVQLALRFGQQPSLPPPPPPNIPAHRTHGL